MNKRPTVGRMVFGGSFIVSGMILPLVTILSGELESLLFALIFTLIFGLAGFWAGGFLYYVHDRLPTGGINFEVLIPGLLFCLPGLMIILLAFLGDESSENAPPIMVAVAGGLFFMAGLYIICLSMAPGEVESGYDLLSTFIIAVMVTCFAVLAGWAVIGAGEQGVVTVGLPFIWIRMPTTLPIGGLCFLPGAVMLVLIAGAMWWRLFKLIISSWKEDM